MKKKGIVLAIKALLCVGVIAVCFIVYTLVSPVAMTEQQTPIFKNQSKDSTQSSAKAKSKEKSCGCCAERMERLRKVLKQQEASSETVGQKIQNQEVRETPN